MTAMLVAGGCATPPLQPKATPADVNPSVHASTLVEEARQLAPSNLSAAQAKWRMARAILEPAIAKDPTHFDAVYDLAYSYDREARALAETDRKTAWAKAGEKFERANTIESSNERTLMSAVCLMRQFMSGNQDKALLDRTQQLLLEGEKRTPGYFAFNLACVAALKPSPADCVVWLTRAQSANALPGRRKIETDAALHTVKDSTEFKAWFGATYPPAPKSDKDRESDHVKP